MKPDWVTNFLLLLFVCITSVWWVGLGPDSISLRMKTYDDSKNTNKQYGGITPYWLRHLILPKNSYDTYYRFFTWNPSRIFWLTIIKTQKDSLVSFKGPWVINNSDQFVHPPLSSLTVWNYLYYWWIPSTYRTKVPETKGLRPNHLDSTSEF